MRKTEQKAQIIYFFILGGSVLWLTGIFLAPYLKLSSPGFSNMIYAVFSSVCHQVSSRCFSFYGHPLPVCARCLGIYFGFLGGVLIFPLLKGFSSTSLPRARNFLLFSLPITVDTIGTFFTLWKSPGGVRFATGFMWGTILPFYLIVGLTDSFLRKRKQPQSNSG